LGATIRNITVSAPACADDIAPMGESKDIQAMVNLLEYNTKRDLVKLNSEKTEIINVSKALQTHPKKYILGGQDTVIFQIVAPNVLFVILSKIVLLYLL
jgi:hypothetical protein